MVVFEQIFMISILAAYLEFVELTIQNIHTLSLVLEHQVGVGHYTFTRVYTLCIKVISELTCMSSNQKQRIDICVSNADVSHHVKLPSPLLDNWQFMLFQIYVQIRIVSEQDFTVQTQIEPSIVVNSSAKNFIDEQKFQIAFQSIDC
jgi:hypothetical protein